MILDSFDGGVFRKRGHGRLACFVIFDHVDGGFESLFMNGGGERGGLFESDENSDIEELVFVDT